MAQQLADGRPGCISTNPEGAPERFYSVRPSVESTARRIWISPDTDRFPGCRALTTVGPVPIQNVVRVTNRGECVAAKRDVRVAKSDSARPAFRV
jgi:hypothetical protein